ncbi:MAG: GNAT family N-acetyltransferase [Bacteroidetes bacterium]|nr:MAG: GNAT family N-acetyltransferase [Bacteroidota bacterium]
MREFFSNIEVGVIVQILSLFIAVATFIIARAIEKMRDRRTANREIYQKLELASIDLFRFEARNLDLIRPVWEKDTNLPAPGTAEFKATTNYVCQMLNLFEIAIKFRQDRILPPDVFGSWVAWFHDLVTAPGFPLFWEDQKWDYLPQLRHIMNAGLKLKAEETDPEVIESKFYEYVSHVLKCDIVRGWTEEGENTPYDDFWDRNKQVRKSKKVTEFNTQKMTVDWITDVSQVPALAQLFIHNSKENYISHGEIQVGRAISDKEWAEDIKEQMEKEFKEALEASPFGPSHLVGASYKNEYIGLILLEYTEFPGGWFATLSDIVVDSRFRNRDLGEKMVKWVTEHLKSMGSINYLPRVTSIMNLLTNF